MGSITLTTVTDELNEQDETFTLTTGSVDIDDTSTISAASHTITIEDDDELRVEVSADDADKVIEEGDSTTFTFMVTGTKTMTAPVAIGYSVSGGTSSGGTLSIAVGESTGKITVGTRDDDVVGPNPSLVVTITSATSAGAVMVAKGTDSTTVEDDDHLTVRVRPDAANVKEGDPATFTVTLSDRSPADVRVGYSVSGVYTVTGDTATVDEATVDKDFTAPYSMLTISAGASSGKITVDTLTDKLLERDETFEVKLDPARSTSTVTVDRTPAITTIKEAASVTLTLDPDSISEDGGVAMVTATVSQDSEMFEVTVLAEAVAPGVAGDFALTANSVLHFAADAPTSTGTVTITAVDNDVDAADKTVTVTGTVVVRGDTLPGLPVTPATLTITDDDERGVTVNPDRLELAPGDPATSYSVRLNSEPTDAVTVQLLTPSNDDYVAVSSRALTFTPNNWNTPQEVEVTAHSNGPANDTVVTISHLASGGDYDGESALVTITIFDPPSVTIEDAGADEHEEEVAFEVTLDAPSGRAVEVNYGTEDGTAKAGEDYRAAEGTLTFAVGQTRATIRISVENDALDEADETFGVRLSDPLNAELPSEPTATGTIIDDDDPPGITIADARAGESAGEVAFPVSLDAPSGRQVTVSYGTEDGTAEAGEDYGAAAGTLTFAAGQTGATIRISVENDALDEADETFGVRLSGPLHVALSDPTATGTIIDDDAAPEITIADAHAGESAGEVAFPVSLDAPSGRQVTVSYGTEDDTAEAGEDYGAAAGTLTFAAGQTSATIRISLVNDALDEADETFSVRLSKSEPFYAELPSDPTATGTIIDDDAAPGITIADARARESAGEITFRVSLNAPSGRQVTVSYGTEDGTAEVGEDYGAAQGTLTFAAGQTSATIRISVENDALDEADETFRVRLSGPLHAELTDSTATGTIIDDDAAPGITIADARARESAGEITFRLSLDAPSGREVEITYGTEDGTAKAGDDYTAVERPLTFVVGQTSATITIKVINDLLVEPDETFSVRLSDPLHAELPSDPTATGTIIDDDVSVPQVWLARFGRTVATHVVDAVGERLNGAAGETSQVTLAGRRLQPAPAPAEPQELVMIPFRAMASHELVAGSSFRLSSAGSEEGSAGDGSPWTGWGRGAVTRLAGEEPKAEMSLKGTVATGAFGVDYDWGAVLTGLALAYSGGGADFQVDAEHLQPRNGMAGSWLVSAHPYARVTVTDALKVWGLLGYGLGSMSLTEDTSVDTSITMMMGAVGVRGTLLWPAANGGFGLAVTSDGFAMRANADAVRRQPAVEADAVRGRLLAEGSYDAYLGDGSVLIPMVEAGVRYDAGHAEEGVGMELGGGVRYVKPEWGLAATAHGRFVLAHQDRGFQEWGLRGSVRLNPEPSGLGLSLGLNSSWGTATSGVQRLWSQGATAPRSAASGGQLDAELSYGVSVNVLGTDALLTPYAGVAVADGGTHAYRVGGRANLGPSFSLSLEGERRDSAGAMPAHGLTLSGSVRW